MTQHHPHWVARTWKGQWIAIVLVFLAVSACSNDTGAQAGTKADEDIVYLRTEPLQITGGGKTHDFTVEIADSWETRQRGLMYRRAMDPDHGMLFLFNAPQKARMWMKNTYISLDMLFVDEQGIIRSIAENTVPESLATLSSGVDVIAVLELIGGRTEALGIRPGHRLVHPSFGD